LVAGFPESPSARPGDTADDETDRRRCCH
jgi:hypothetical protein